MRVIVAIFFLSILITVAPAWAQDVPATPAAQGRAPVPPSPTPAEIEMQRHMAKQRNQERFAKIKKDTDQLLELATQLKKSVDQASEETLSLEVIRKAEQIEKLARHVRQKMLAE
jgi:hypothetical protein